VFPAPLSSALVVVSPPPALLALAPVELPSGVKVGPVFLTPSHPTVARCRRSSKVCSFASISCRRLNTFLANDPSIAAAVTMRMAEVPAYLQTHAHRELKARQRLQAFFAITNSTVAASAKVPLAR